MKSAYMLQSKRDKRRYLLQGEYPCWFPARLSNTENPSTYGTHFICENKQRAEELADKWNKRVGKDGEHVTPVKVLRGFVPLKQKTAEFGIPPESVPNDLVWRQDVYRMLHEIGGTDAEKDSWSDGWDKAIDTAIEKLETLDSAHKK